MAGYIGSKASVVSSGAERKKTFAITTTTTALTGLVYTPTKVHVFHNGVRLVDGTDFTATNSTSITLTVAAESGDQVVVVSYASFQTSDTVSASAGGTFAGNIDVTGTATATADFKAHSSSSGDYVRMYGGTGTGKWDIYGNGANLRIGDNESAGFVQFDTNVGIGTAAPLSKLDVSNSFITVSKGSATTGRMGASDYIVGGTDNDFVIQSSGTGVTRFVQSSSEAMRISSGKVLIGTTTEGQGQADNLTISDSGNMGMTLRSTDNGECSIFFSDATSGAGEYAGSVQYAHSTNSMSFGTSGVARISINSGGGVDIGGFATTGTVDGVKINPDGSGIQTKSATTGFHYHNRFYNSNGQVGYISTQTSATQYNTSSDYRLKTDAQPMTNASSRVQALNPVNFEWIADGSRVDGFLAHEAATVVPEAVSGDKDAMQDEEYEVTPAVYEDVVIEAVLDDEGNELEAERTEQNLVTEAVMGTRSVPDYQGIDQSKLVPLLTAALQEALNKIDTMETRLAALEGN